MVDDFDVEEHASSLVQSNANVSDYVANLMEAERELDIKLEDHVSAHHHDLLNQATGVEKLEDELSAVSAQSAALLASVEKARARVADPYETIRNQTTTLARLQETCDLMRRIFRILQLGKKLQHQLNGGNSEITKAAQSLNEFSELWDPEAQLLSGIEAIEAEKRLFRHARTDVERSADSMLRSGLESKSQSQIGTALQVYHNLGVLNAKIEQIVADKISVAKSSLKTSLNVKKIEASAVTDPKLPNSKGPVQVSEASFRSQLWTNIESSLDCIKVVVTEMIQLQKVLYKKRDQMGVPFAECLTGDAKDIVVHVWQGIVQAIETSFKTGCSDSAKTKQTLESEFPKLVRLFNDLWTRLCQATCSSLAADPSIVIKHPFNEDSNAYREVLTDFERAYLSRSLSKLFDPVNLMFSNSSKLIKGNESKTMAAPSNEELEQVFRVISSELTIANKVDKTLCLAVAKNVSKTVRLMCNKCEQVMIFDDEASQVVGYPTDDQRTNVKVVNCLWAFQRGLEDILNAHKLTEDLKDVERLCVSVLEPLATSSKEAIEAIILTMHSEQEFGKDVAESQTEKVSPYMKEMKAFVARISNDFFAHFSCKKLLAQHVSQLTISIVELFVLHTSLVRPLGSVGQKRLAYDASQLEPILEPLVTLSLSVSGFEKGIEAAFKQLASLRSVLFAKPEEVPDLQCLKDGLLRHSTALHFIFSKSPPELKSPHESAGWGISRYSAWLEDHPAESDRLQLIQGALESYVAGTRLRREKSYVHPYPVMLKLLQSALN